MDVTAKSFAEFTAELYAARYTGAITLHFLNGQPQMVELGRPIVWRFPEHPANKSVDRQPGPTAFSTP